MRRFSAGLIAVGAVVASAALGGRFGPTPGHPGTILWYWRLRKPDYTPPGPLIGAAWMALDSLLCVSGYRLLAAPPTRARNTAVAAWAVCVAGVAAHPWLFFGRRSIGAGLGVVATMIAASSVSAIAAAKVDRVAAICGLPLVAWTWFAGLLNEEIVRKN